MIVLAVVLKEGLHKLPVSGAHAEQGLDLSKDALLHMDMRPKMKKHTLKGV